MKSKAAPEPMLYRDASIDTATLKGEERECELSFSSEQPVQRYDWRDGKDYMEVLSHEAKDCDLSRMNSGHPLLLNHDTDMQIGVVKSARIDEADKKGRASVKFSRSAKGQEIYQDVQDGIRTLVSVGYRVGREVKREQRDGMEYRTFAWTPFEVSIVPVPADPSVGVGRSENQPAEETQTIERTISMPETNTPPVIDEAKIRAEAGKTETKRVNEILEVGRKFNIVEDAAAFIRDGKTTEDFYRHALEKQGNAKPINTTAEVGLDAKEKRDYSLVRAIRAHVTGNWKEAGLERAASDAMAKIVGRDTSGFFIPSEISHTRDLTAGTNNLGKYSVQTNVLGSSLIELLRNMTVAKELGARMLSGLQGNVAIPSQAGGATAYWVAENGQTTSSNLTFGQLSLTPHRLSAVSALSKQLIAQSSVDVEALVREDFARILAIAIDSAALTGDGSGSSPTGILSTSGIGSVTFGAAATYQKMIDMETSVAQANALVGSPAYVVDSATRAKLKTAAKLGSTYPVFIWEGPLGMNSQMPGEGTVNGYRAVSTEQLATDHKVIFGNFGDLIVADWVGMDVTVDPYTLADKNQIKITVNMLADIGVRHVGSFCASSDAGNQ